MKALQGQSLFDIAIQAAGTPEAAFELAMGNGLSITDELPAGSPLNPPQGGLRANAVAAYYTQRNLHPATGISETEVAEAFGGEGIEFWYVEYDFIVN